MEGDRGLLFEAMVFPLSELTAQAGRKPSLVDNAYVADDRRIGMANSIAHRLLSYSQEILLSRGRQALFGYAG